MKYSDPFKILPPNERWAPSQSQMDAFQDAYEKLLPPLVYKIRLAVTKWRENNYQGASGTSKHNNGAIFVQTICDYPLVKAIKQNVVKSPVLPDEASRQKIQEKDSSDFIERYKDFIHLGYLEWEQQYEDLKNYKTPILFIMTMSTKEADKAAAFLESNYTKMKKSVLTIHTNNSGEIKETATTKKAKEELVFNDIEGDFSHKTIFKDTIPDYRNVIGFFTSAILKTTFKKAIDELTITDKGTAEVKNDLKSFNNIIKIFKVER